MTALIQYERARSALAQCRTVGDVLTLRAEMDHLKLHARHVRDRALMADALEIQIWAERRLGELIDTAEKDGLIGPGRPKKRGAETLPDGEGFTLKEAGITHKLSAKAQKLSSISERAVQAMIDGMRARVGGHAAVIVDPMAADDKKQRRANREASLGMMQQALPDKRYGVILADPEWRFEPYSRETGMDRAPENHYPTSSMEVIAARDVPSISADDCVLFLWATVPMLPQALTVMGAWGFNYKSHSIWHKDRIGTGYWFRNTHELLLVGTRGNIPAPAPGTQWASVITAPVGAHSAKPEVILRMIEEYFPSLPKIELNRRGPARPGWDAWGNESLPPHDPATGEILDPLPQDDVSRLATSSLGRPAPVPGNSGAGSPIPQIDPYAIPEFCRRTA